MSMMNVSMQFVVKFIEGHVRKVWIEVGFQLKMGHYTLQDYIEIKPQFICGPLTANLVR